MILSLSMMGEPIRKSIEKPSRAEYVPGVLKLLAGDCQIPSLGSYLPIIRLNSPKSELTPKSEPGRAEPITTMQNSICW